MESSTAEATRVADEEQLASIDAASNGAGLEGESPDEQRPEQEPLVLEIEGEGQLTLTVGGAKPEVSTVKLVGGKMDIAQGDFDKGARVNLLIKGVVTEVSFIDSYDQYGNISGTERRHKIRPHGVERIRD